MTLIELVIVVAVMAILLVLAVPTYSTHMLRVHRSEAIRLLLQTSICQERMYASFDRYDLSRCLPISEYKRYRITYASADNQDQRYIARAEPQGPQLDDPCGSLSMDQSGTRSIGGSDVSVAKCWNGR